MSAPRSLQSILFRGRTRRYPHSKMAEPRADTYVCDLKLIARSRLLCGLYSRRAVPPRWRGFAKAYCLTLAIGFLIYIYFAHKFWVSLSLLHWIPVFGQYFLSLIVSLWTGDEYIYKLFTRNKMTDVTLDSPTVFNRLQKQITKAYFFAWAHLVLGTVLSVPMFYERGLMYFIVMFIPSVITNIFVAHTYSTKLLVMGHFNSRILLLRRRLERCGFRTIGRAPPQPYCQIYNKIWQDLEAVNCPVKLLLFFDLIFTCCKITGFVVFCSFEVHWQEWTGVKLIVPILFNIGTLFLQLVIFFGHVALLESAATHCEAMAVFTVTQLIKTPSAEERRRMYALLGALEQRGARYRVLRALPLDARLVLQALGFCSAQAIVLINIFVNRD